MAKTTNSTYVESPLMTPLGHPTNKVLVRTYNDGTVMYVCSENGCDFQTDRNWQTVSTHRRKDHYGQALGRPKGLPNKKNRDPRMQAVSLLTQAIELLTQEEDTSETEAWRLRALKAERRIRTLKGIFKDDE